MLQRDNYHRFCLQEQQMVTLILPILIFRIKFS